MKNKISLETLKAMFIWITIWIWINLFLFYSFSTIINLSSNYRIEQYKSLKFVDKSDFLDFTFKDLSNNSIRNFLTSDGKILWTYNKEDKVITIEKNLSDDEKYNQVFFHEYLHYLFYKNYKKLTKEEYNELVNFIKRTKQYLVVPESYWYDTISDEDLLTETISYMYDTSYNTCRERSIFFIPSWSKFDYEGYLHLEAFWLLPKWLICKE